MERDLWSAEIGRRTKIFLEKMEDVIKMWGWFNQGGMCFVGVWIGLDCVGSIKVDKTWLNDAYPGWCWAWRSGWSWPRRPRWLGTCSGRGRTGAPIGSPTCPTATRSSGGPAAGVARPSATGLRLPRARQWWSMGRRPCWLGPPSASTARPRSSWPNLRKKQNNMQVQCVTYIIRFILMFKVMLSHLLCVICLNRDCSCPITGWDKIRKPIFSQGHKIR